MAEANHTCRHCGGAITHRVCKTGATSNAARIYCSARCRQGSREKRRGPRIHRGTRPLHALTCQGCGKQAARPKSSGWDTLAFCSKACAYATRARAKAEGAEAARMVALVGAEVRALARIARYVERPRKTRRPCTGCGVPVIGVMGYSRRCHSCDAKAKREQARRMRVSPAGKARRRIDKAARRAIERGAQADRIDPIRVFERDGWRCYLCGVDTPREMRGTYAPNAPELEHVVPLAAGGEHAWTNVRCACRRCNGLKGASLAA